MYFPNGKEVFRLYFGCFVSIMLPIRDIAIAKQLGGLCLSLVWGSFLIIIYAGTKPAIEILEPIYNTVAKGRFGCIIK